MPTWVWIVLGIWIAGIVFIVVWNYCAHQDPTPSLSQIDVHKQIDKFFEVGPDVICDRCLGFGRYPGKVDDGKNDR
jgi:hypothetical protein